MTGMLNIDGKQYAVIPLDECARLTGQALPDLPEADAKGTRRAREAIRATIARSVIQRRLKAGLSQAALAERAGIHAETLSRIETGKHRPQAATRERLEQALGEVT